MISRPPDTDISNWRQEKRSPWAFQHVREVLPTALISRGVGNTVPFEIAETDFGTIDLPAPEGTWRLEEMHRRSHTDSMLVVHNGSIIYRWHAPHTDAGLPHILFSISKSITACIAGILQARGIVDPDAPVTDYLPGTKHSAYADCTVQHVLDMSVALDFNEDYMESEGDGGDYTRYRKATGWNPVNQNHPGPDLESYLYSLPKLDQPHGHIFRYRSPNSDLLGLILERAAGTPLATLISEHLWSPMGAETNACITIDRNGLARGAGGVCITITDLARLGQLFIDQGRARNTNQVLPTAWVEDTLNHGNQQAWRNGDLAYLLPDGNYRNQWYQTNNHGQELWAMGIYGQYLYINLKHSIVIAKQSSQPLPVDDPTELAVMQSLQRLAAIVAG